MRGLSPLLLAACAALAGPASADVYLKVEADGSVTLTDEARPGYRRAAGGPGHEPPPTAEALAPRSPLSRDAVSAVARLPFAPQVAAAAAEHGLPAALLHAVIRAESNYDPQAVSPRGAIGLMQLMPATARELGAADARDPGANIRAGARYLKRLMQQFGNDVELAVAAYNAGPQAVARIGRIPDFAETRRYVPRVIDEFNRLRKRAVPDLS